MKSQIVKFLEDKRYYIYAIIAILGILLIIEAFNNPYI